MRPEIMTTSALRPVGAAAALLIAVGCLGVAAPAAAQQRMSSPGDGRTQGMRYLSWPGKAERPRMAPAVDSALPEPAPIAVEPASRGPIMSFSSPPALTTPNRYSARTSPGLTPASAWVTNGGAPTPPYAPPPYATPVPYAPPPTYAAAPIERPDMRTYAPASVAMPEPPRDFAPAPPLTAPTYQPPYETPPVPRYEPPSAAMPRVAADTGPAAPPTPEPQPVFTAPALPEPRPEPAPEPAAPPASAAPAFDPMAPRPDAPIFRLNRGGTPAPMPVAPPTGSAEGAPPVTEAQPATSAVPDVPGDRQSRRYSVHRQNGQTPDRTPLPDPVFLDSAPVDLAEPPATPTVMRNIDGRIQAIVPNEDPTLP